MKDVVLNKLFQLIGFNSEAELDECKVNNVSFIEKTRTLEINLSFNNVPPVQSLYRMNKALKEGSEVPFFNHRSEDTINNAAIAKLQDLEAAESYAKSHGVKVDDKSNLDKNI